jgi:hypothetical protein
MIGSIRPAEWLMEIRIAALIEAIIRDYIDLLAPLATAVFIGLKYFLENPLFTAIFASIAVLSAMIVMWFYFFLRGRITSAASSLGYSEPIEPAKGISDLKRDRYTNDDALSALFLARVRLIDHISTLRNNAVVNLFIGISIATVGVGILFTAILQIGSIRFDQIHDIEPYKIILIVIAPKLSITLFIQIFAYFFLAMYRSNQVEIRYFQNEITV